MGEQVNSDGGGLFSDAELELLAAIARRRNIPPDSLLKLLAREREMEHMGRRHNLHNEIRLEIETVAEARRNSVPS